MIEERGWRKVSDDASMEDRKRSLKGALSKTLFSARFAAQTQSNTWLALQALKRNCRFRMYHLSIKSISRSDGRTATAAAAYRAGAEIADLRTGELHNYKRKGDVLRECSGIVVPAGAPSWAEDRAALWNAAEAAEKRKNSRVARDYEVTIPKELTLAQGVELVRAFAHEISDRYAVAVDFNFHSDDPRTWDGTEKGYQGYHSHILTTTRKLGVDGFGAKSLIEMSDTQRRALGLSDVAGEIEFIRERWEILANRHLERAGQEARIDRRSLKDQGIDREPTVHLGADVTALERKGKVSKLGDINRRVMAEGQERASVGAEIEVEERELESGLETLTAETSRQASPAKKKREARKVDPEALGKEQQPERAEPAALPALPEPVLEVSEKPGGRLRRIDLASLDRVDGADLLLGGPKQEAAAEQEPAVTVKTAEPVQENPQAALALKMDKRSTQIQRVTEKSQRREARRLFSLERHVARKPQAPQGQVAALAQKGYEEVLKAWEQGKELAARLVQEARQLGQWLSEIAAPERIRQWAEKALLKKRGPEVLAKEKPLEEKLAKEKPAMGRPAREEPKQVQGVVVKVERAAPEEQAPGVPRVPAAQPVESVQKPTPAEEARRYFEGLTGEQLRAVIEQKRPPDAHVAVERDPGLRAAEQAKALLVEKYQKIEKTSEYAAEQVKLWRAKHPVRAAAHDRGVAKAEFLDETTRARQLRELEQRQLSEQFEDAKRDAKKVRQEVEARVDKEHAEAQRIIDVLEPIARGKEATERAERIKKEVQGQALQAFVELASKRKRGLPGYGDADAAWQAVSAPHREGIDKYNRLPEAQRRDYLQSVQQTIERDPLLAGGFLQMVRNVIQQEPYVAPELKIDRGPQR